jgi:crotonobetainyl-CoA:carnitine CoA-transferase CaiB-like acyl-CoA transferase
MENFGAGAMGRLGLDYPELAQIRPGLVMVSMPAFGRTGPESAYVAHGPTIEAAAGNVALQGYPGGPPSPSGVLAWGDPVAGLTGGVAALVALTYQRLTGNGTHVDLSHLEAAIPFNFQVFLDHTANGVIRPRLGNTEGCAGPQGCYPCRGDNRWITLSCPDDAASVRLSKLIGFDGIPDRQAVDARITAWTSEREIDDVVRQLRRAGIPAGGVLSAPDLLADPQLAARGFFRTVTHPDAGTHRYPGMPWRSVRRPWRSPAPAPRFGEHNEQVLASLLGLGADEIENLYRDKVIARQPLTQGD